MINDDHSWSSSSTYYSWRTTNKLPRRVSLEQEHTNMEDGTWGSINYVIEEEIVAMEICGRIQTDSADHSTGGVRGVNPRSLSFLENQRNDLIHFICLENRLPQEY